MAQQPAGYEPLYKLKPVAPHIWIADGPWIRLFGLPFPTRMTVIRLSNGHVWVHSPIEINSKLEEEIATIGPVRYLIAPNWIHYAWISPWQKLFPDAKTFVSPGVVERAKKKGLELQFDEELGNEAPAQWAEEIDQRLADSGVHKEIVFFHRPSRTLILTDLIENFEKDKMPWWTRPFLKLGGVCAPSGGMPRDLELSFKRRSEHFKNLVAEMIAWRPEKIVIAHGKWFEKDGVKTLERAFCGFLR